ncbi:glycosyltransferase family 39 protein [Paraflavisolibacter sp. H34]|uniref:ArnT family glycosyltransferase n=1 Tax=Huijunlia imazamoxiresistens TaxID=3127457 RepID=UPI00301AA750
MESKLKIRPLHFTLFWLVLNLLQAAFTQLTSDEGYYWFYTRALDWGYYDHPPFLALLIKAGYSLFPNEFGVRFFYVLLNSIGVYLLFGFVDPNDSRRLRLMYAVLLSLPLFHYLSFLVFPDGPFLFFSVVFLVGYKRFLEKDDWASALLMGVSTALMMYSKYHAVLVVGFTVLSNLRLLRSLKFYAAMLLALLLFVPHIRWQFAHDFATFQYHLSGRSSQLSFRHVGEYISQQLGALTPVLLVVPFFYKSRDRFERALQAIIIGSLLFFLLSSFKNFIHFHWTSLTLFPLIVIAPAWFLKTGKTKLLRRGVLPFAFVVLLFRLYLVFRIVPVNHIGIDYYHGRDLWAQDIRQVAGDRPVFFRNNFRESSLYSFYSGGLGVSLQSGEKRRSQYEFWHYEDSLQHREVVLVRDHPFEGSQWIQTRMGKEVHYRVLPDFTSYYDQGIQTSFPRSIRPHSVVLVDALVSNPRATPVTFAADSTGNAPTLFYSLRKGRKEVARGPGKVFTEPATVAAGGQLPVKVSVALGPLEPGTYTIVFGLSRPLLDDAYNSAVFETVVQ